MLSLKQFRSYTLRNRHFGLKLLADTLRMARHKLLLRKTAVITTGGVGDYLWMRSYYSELRKAGYRVVAIAMSHWREIADGMDSNEADIIRYFENCNAPRRIELLFFRLFSFDMLISLRHSNVNKYIRAKKTFTDADVHATDSFYEDRNNAIVSLAIPLPGNFRHTLPTPAPPAECRQLLRRPYALLNTKGNTQGALSDSQVDAIARHLSSLGYDILVSGNPALAATENTTAMGCRIIDGARFKYIHFPWLVANARLVVTPNTSIYHMATLLDKPCVVISANEYNTVKLNHPAHTFVFDDSLQKAYDENRLASFTPAVHAHIDQIDPQRIIAAIEQLVTRRLLQHSEKQPF